MTPKEKAKYLVDKFYQTTPNEAWINEPVGLSEEYKAWKQAKECALIAVDEILSLMIKFHNRHIEDNSNEIIFWELVKEELEKL